MGSRPGPGRLEGSTGVDSGLGTLFRRLVGSLFGLSFPGVEEDKCAKDGKDVRIDFMMPRRPGTFETAVSMPC